MIDRQPPFGAGASGSGDVDFFPRHREPDEEDTMPPSDRLAWWREARFGMFIHWGLYAVAAGVWKGKRIPWLGEWIMRHARIPLAEYRALGERFDPRRFDANAWVRLAKRAGMKYLVITAKHHDGFALFDSECSDYDIPGATPYPLDPLSELAGACGRQGLKLGFYYSHVRDWHHPDAKDNDWDYPDEGRKNFRRYLDEKAFPQLRELLTKYGPVGLIWFDTPMDLTREEAEEVRDLVRDIQPDCLVSGRVGYCSGDYFSTGDNYIPHRQREGDWETPATMNETWGYKSWDHHWKSAKRLLFELADTVSKGGELPA